MVLDALYDRQPPTNPRPDGGRFSGLKFPVYEAHALTLSEQDGTWGRVYRQLAVGRAPAIFLDRDGVIIEEVGYLHRIEDVRLMPGASDLIGAANDRSIPVVVVTNQAGIGRGLYDWSDFEAVTESILQLLATEGATIDAVYACPFHPEALAPFAHPSHPDRKPNPGMMIRAAAELDLDLARSWMIGDKLVDIEAARSAELRGAVHLLTGYGLRDRTAVRQLLGGRLDIVLAADLIEARSMMPPVASEAHDSCALEP